MGCDRGWAFDEIREGASFNRRYRITPATYQSYLAAFGDRSRLHIDPEFARSRGFKDQVMHGGILNGFLSHFVGMIFPGNSAVLLTDEMRFIKPNYLNDELELQVSVAGKSTATRTLVLHVAFLNLTNGYVSATGRAHVSVMEEL
jgi:acyl dehydratase